MTLEQQLWDALNGLVGWVEGGCEEDGQAYVLAEAKAALSAVPAWPDFKMGDRVRHQGGGEGTVTKIDHEGVHVTYAKNTGIYGKDWFSLHPNALAKI